MVCGGFSRVIGMSETSTECTVHIIDRCAHESCTIPHTHRNWHHASEKLLTTAAAHLVYGSLDIKKYLLGVANSVVYP